MTSYWVTLLLGVTFLHNSLTLSPVPVLDDEWEEFSRMMRDTSYRLPTTSSPRHYEVTLTPYFDNPPENTQPFTFDGTVKIYTTITEENIQEIVIHCNDLTIETLTVGYYDGNSTFVDVTRANQTFECEEPTSFLRIQATETFMINRDYEISATFRGNLQTNMRGFYRSWYVDSTGNKRWMATTQFQPHHARQAFPCYDEPGFKATFDITIVREDEFSETISNMPINITQVLGNGRTAETFYTSPFTSTYLLAFIVSHYEQVENNNDTERPFAIYARDNVGSTGRWALEIGEALLEAMEQYTDYPYYSVATNMNMKQAAIPDFSAGAMENWGLLTYREALILYDELESNNFYKQRIGNIVAHEVAHMWFGNLVTCAWWNVLWLNEGFGRFYQYFLTEKVAPELGYETRFITEQLHVSMLSDALDTAHPLTDPSVEDPASVSAFFSTISYAKGASVLRMTQHLLGEDTYVKGLRYFLKAREFNVAEPIHLYQALDQAAAEDNALSTYDITIAEYLRKWSEYAGHPLLTVVVNQRTGEMIVTQARFNRNTGISSIPTVYDVPLTWTRGGAPNFEDTKPVAIMSSQVLVLQRGTTGNEWVIFNKQHTGFYRVNYDATNWALITQALRSNQRTVIHDYNRANIVDDVFVFARANVLSYTRAFNILSFLEFEDAYAPWDAAITGLNFVIRRLAHDADNLQKLYEYISTWSTAVVAKLGYSDVSGESYMDGLQRMYVMQFLCNSGHNGCKTAALQHFQNWRNGVFLPANMRPWVWCEGLRQGNADDFDYFWNEYFATDLANNQVVMLQAAGCTKDQQSLEKFLDAIVDSSEVVRPQDYATALNSAVAGNDENPMMVFDWLKRNIEPTTAAFGSIATPLSYIAARLLNEDNIQEFETWVTENRALIGETSYNTGISGAASARSNLAWSEIRMTEFADFFETGYVEEVIDDLTESEEEVDSTDSEETEQPEEYPDSANISVISFVTLTFALSVSFFA